MGLTHKNFYEKKEETPIEKKEVKIEFSFDDGYKNDLQSAAILEKYNLRGTFYIILDRVGNDGFLNWDDIKDLEKRGHTIGSHTMSHPQDLKILYDQDLHVEIQNSKDLLESVLGHSVPDFCYPRGRYDDRVKHFVADAGYLKARVTGAPGKITVEDPLLLPGTVQLFPRHEYEDTPILDYAKKVIDRVKKEGGYCNIWMHGNDLEKYQLFGTLEEICKYVTS